MNDSKSGAAFRMRRWLSCLPVICGRSSGANLVTDTRYTEDGDQFAAAARWHDQQMAQALFVPPPAFGKRFVMTPFQRWYWDNLVAGDQSWRP